MMASAWPSARRSSGSVRSRSTARLWPAAAQGPRSLHRPAGRRDEELPLGPVEDVNVNGPVLPGGDAPRMRRDGPAPRAIDGLAVGGEPDAHLSQALHLLGLQLPIGLRP